jgi:hypothetical protein
VNLSIDLVAPGLRLSIEIWKVFVFDSDHKIIPYKLYCPFYLSFCLPSIGPAQDGLKAVKASEVLELPVQRGVFLFQKTFDYHLFHVVVEDFLRVSSKIPERVLVAPDQCICTHIRHKLDIAHPRIPQYHKETVQFLPFPILIDQMVLEEAPVHLPLFSRHGFKPHRCLFIQIHFLSSDIFFYDTVLSVKSLFLQFFQYPYCGIRRFLQPLVYLLLVSIQFCWLWLRQCVLRLLW